MGEDKGYFKNPENGKFVYLFVRTVESEEVIKNTRCSRPPPLL